MQTNVYLSRQLCSFLAWEVQRSVENNEHTYRHFFFVVSSQHSRSFGQRQHPFMIPWLLFPINVFLSIESCLSLPPFVVDYFTLILADPAFSRDYYAIKIYIKLPVSHLKLSDLLFEFLRMISVIVLFFQPLGIFCSLLFQQKFGITGPPRPVQESLIGRKSYNYIMPY